MESWPHKLLLSAAEVDVHRHRLLRAGGTSQPVNYEHGNLNGRDTVHGVGQQLQLLQLNPPANMSWAPNSVWLGISLQLKFFFATMTFTTIYELLQPLNIALSCVNLRMILNFSRSLRWNQDFLFLQYLTNITKKRSPYNRKACAESWQAFLIVAPMNSNLEMGRLRNLVCSMLSS